ncbi:MAG: hypothetical protein J6W72_01180, partial [Candidatus Methanomethylophilaceae archaeon]|nr:hypothetical protein [Candidatus Methanomethylophilaceae archaeon]
LKEIVKNVFSAVRMKRTGKPVKVSKFTAFGLECKDILAGSVSSWYEEKEIAEIKERASNLKLDREAVTGAQEALRDVTRMLKTEEEEQSSEPVTKPIEVKEASGSWSALIEAMDDSQKGYLKASIEGKGKAFLKENGLIMTRVEDSINGLAMDRIGDNIIENGEIFEEYLADIKACL